MGKQLKGKNTLHDYGIEKDSALQFVLYLRRDSADE
jgi:hypothetical protein